MEEEERTDVSVSEQVKIVERAPAMYKRVRFQDEERTDSATQTEELIECEMCSLQAGISSTFLEIAESLGYVVPPTRAKKLKNGRLCIRRQSGSSSEWEFIKKKHCDKDDMCKDRIKRTDKGARRKVQTTYAERCIELDTRLSALRAELAAARACGPRKIISERERRPYHYSVAESESVGADEEFKILPIDPIGEGRRAHKPHGCKKQVVDRRWRSQPWEDWPEIHRPSLPAHFLHPHGHHHYHHHKHRHHDRHYDDHHHRWRHHGRPHHEHHHGHFRSHHDLLGHEHKRHDRDLSFDDEYPSEWTGIHQRIVIPRRRLRRGDCDGEYEIAYESREPEDYFC